MDTLQAVPAPASIAEDKGIKRAADKMLLPPSVGNILMDQKAYTNGAYFFELKNEVGRMTHAGLLDFASAEGFVAIPPKVARCLWGPNCIITEAVDTVTGGAPMPGLCSSDTISGPLQVTYRRLSKGTKVVFQPRSAEFQSKVGEQIREVLEEALLQHSCLTVGDWIQVVYEGECFDVRVRELEPENAVSIIDTEMEAEIHPSVETEEKIIEEEMAARKALEEKRLREREELARAKQQQHDHAVRQEQLASIQEQKRKILPTEPEDLSDSIGILLRFPNGEKYSRRFLPTDAFNAVFDFADSMGAGGNFPGDYVLVTQYPRRVFSNVADIAASDTFDAERDGFDAATTCIGDIEGFSVGSRQVIFLEPQNPGNEL